MATASYPEHVTQGGLHILVATDASIAGNAAVAWAASTFRLSGTTICVVHVVEGDQNATAPTAARATLKAMISELDAGDARVEACVVSGRPVWDALSKQAASTKSDVLVIGVRGHSRLPWVRLGTTARRLVRAAPCPVLAIPPREGQTAGKPLHGLVGIDFSEESAIATSAAVRLLTAAGGGKLTLLHVCEEPTMPYEAMGYGPVRIAEELVEHRRKEAMHLLDGLAVDATRGNIRAEAAVASGQPARRIEHYATESKCDFIAAGTRGHTLMQRMFLGSVAQHLLEGHAVPILTARTAATEQGIPLTPANTDEAYA